MHDAVCFGALWRSRAEARLTASRCSCAAALSPLRRRQFTVFRGLTEKPPADMFGSLYCHNFARVLINLLVRDLSSVSLHLSSRRLSGADANLLVCLLAVHTLAASLAERTSLPIPAADDRLRHPWRLRARASVPDIPRLRAGPHRRGRGAGGGRVARDPKRHHLVRIAVAVA